MCVYHMAMCVLPVYLFTDIMFWWEVELTWGQMEFFKWETNVTKLRTVCMYFQLTGVGPVTVLVRVVRHGNEAVLIFSALGDDATSRIEGTALDTICNRQEQWSYLEPFQCRSRIYIRDPHLVIIVPEDVLAPHGARPSEGSVMNARVTHVLLCNFFS